MRVSSVTTWWRAGLPGLLALALVQPVAAGEFRLLLEGEAGVRDEGGYGQQQDPALRRDDALARAGLNLQLSYALERLNLAMNYSPSYERSLEDSDLSGTSQRLDFGLVADLNQRLRLNIREQLLQTPDLYLYSAVATPETTVETRQGDQLSHVLDVSAEQTFSRRASLIIGATHSLRRFEQSNLVDSETLGVRVGAGFDLVRGQRIDIMGGLAEYDYKDRGDANVRTYGVGYGRDFGRSSHVRIEGGGYSVGSSVRTGEPVEPGGPRTLVDESDSGWRGSLQLSQERRLFRWGAGLSHDISAGAGLGRAAQADNAFASISTSIGRNWTVGLDGNASRQKDLSSRDRLDVIVPDDPGNPDGGSSPDDLRSGDELTEFAAGTARFGWTFAPAFRLDGAYSRVWQRARVEPFANLSYSRYFLGLAFRIFSTGETPAEPEDLGRPTDENSDPQ